MPRIDTERLTEYAEQVFGRSSYFNDYTLQTIGRRIKAIGQLNTADQIALKNMADISGDMEAITKRLAEIAEMNIADIEKIYSQVITEGVNSYKPLFDFKNMEFMPFEQNEFAKQLVRNWAAQTAGEMINLSRTKALCFDKYNLKGELIGSTPLEGAFQKAVDDAVTAVSSGTVDFNTAMRETIKNLGGSGVKVNYGNNVTRRLDSMIRQNLLYGAKQSAQAYDEYIGGKLGCDGFEVDYHPNARPSHRFMGGNMYSYKGDVTIDGVTYKDGSEALARLEDYGCLHFKDDVILGVSEPRYNKDWLEAQKKKDSELIEYNGVEKTGYEWKQTQRRLESETRRQRDISFMAKESGDNVLAKECNANIKSIREKYDDLCDKTGLEPRLERMAVYNSKNVDNGGKSGIIEVGSEGMYRKSQDGKIEPMPKKQLQRIAKSFKAKGGMISYSDETDKYLERNNAEAITYNQNTILLKKNPGRASVFEELIHATQYRNGENDGSYISRLRCEIEAQKKLIKYSKAYKLTEVEVIQTKEALKAYEDEYRSYIKKGGD